MIKSSKLKWSGYIVRMEDNVPCMKIKSSQPEVSRKKERPRFNGVIQYKKNLGNELMMEKTGNRDLWMETSSRPRRIRDCSTKQEEEDFHTLHL
jgi:hypothetical protein